MRTVVPRQAERLPAAQALGFFVLHLADDHTVAVRKWSSDCTPAAPAPLARRDEVAVRVLHRLAEVRGNRLLQGAAK